jgi:N-acetylmuramoyl-L-alanine amidase
MRQYPLRFIAITSVLVLVATAGVVSFEGTATAGGVTVRQGDTLWDLSRRYHVSVNRLASANGMSLQDVLPIGRKLAIPSPSRAAAAAGSSNAKTASKGGSGSVAAASTKAVSTKAVSAKAVSAKAATTKAAAASAAATAGPAAAAPPAPQYTAAQLAQMRGFCVSYRAPSGSTPLPDALVAHPERLALRPLFVKWSKTYGLSASLIEAIAWQESGWQNDVVSSANAQGIGQLLPTTAAFVSGTLLGMNLKLSVASDNIQMMVRFYAYLLKAAGGNQCVAVASYYQGFGAYQHVGVLPQSQDYVRSVFNLRPHFS